MLFQEEFADILLTGKNLPLTGKNLLQCGIYLLERTGYFFQGVSLRRPLMFCVIGSHLSKPTSGNIGPGFGQQKDNDWDLKDGRPGPENGVNISS